MAYVGYKDGEPVMVFVDDDSAEMHLTLADHLRQPGRTAARKPVDEARAEICAAIERRRTSRLAGGGGQEPITGSTGAATIGGVTAGTVGGVSSSGGGGVAPRPEPPTVEQLKELVDGVARALQVQFGPRSSCIVLLGIPLDNGHDRFVAACNGPCLTQRGLLAWGERQVREHIDRGDSSRNGGKHP